MWESCFQSLAKLEENEGSGCILAHCMGLGKPLQVIALIHTLLTNKLKTKFHKVLIICPLSIVLNWINEFNIWLKRAKLTGDFQIYDISG